MEYWVFYSSALHGWCVLNVWIRKCLRSTRQPQRGYCGDG